MNWLKWLFFGDEPMYQGWTSIDNPPEKGKRVLVRSKDGEVNIGHLDNEVVDLWIAFTLEISGKHYKFNIKEPYQWKPLPK